MKNISSNAIASTYCKHQLSSFWLYECSEFSLPETNLYFEQSLCFTKIHHICLLVKASFRKNKYTTIDNWSAPDTLDKLRNSAQNKPSQHIYSLFVNVWTFKRKQEKSFLLLCVQEHFIFTHEKYETTFLRKKSKTLIASTLTHFKMLQTVPEVEIVGNYLIFQPQNFIYLVNKETHTCDFARVSLMQKNHMKRLIISK